MLYCMNVWLFYSQHYKEFPFQRLTQIPNLCQKKLIPLETKPTEQDLGSLMTFLLFLSSKSFYEYTDSF